MYLDLSYRQHPELYPVLQDVQNDGDLMDLIKQKMVKFTILVFVIWIYFYVLAGGPEIALVHSFPAFVLTKYITHQQKMLLFHLDGLIRKQHLFRGLGGADS